MLVSLCRFAMHGGAKAQLALATLLSEDTRGLY
jgi:hypothetical protein